MEAQGDGFVVGGDIAVRLRRSARARRMSLRVTRAEGEVILTLPLRASLAEGLAFARAREGWLRRVRAGLPPRPEVAHGVLIPVEGRALRVTPAALLRAPRVAGDRLELPERAAPGPAAEVFLRQLARARLAAACDRHAARLGRPFRAIVLRDTRSRWGSCSVDGRLMFSWRLVMAPPEVLDYVAAHEVAHLQHMDHSPAFWATTARLAGDPAAPRAWLRANGAGLLAWRFSASRGGIAG